MLDIIGSFNLMINGDDDELGFFDEVIDLCYVWDVIVYLLNFILCGMYFFCVRICLFLVYFRLVWWI